MKGFLVSFDVATGLLLTSLSLLLLVHTATSALDSVADLATVLLLKKRGEHALSVLLFSEGEFRCRYGEENIPVPLCVWDSPVDRNLFWGWREVNCALNTSDPQVTARLSYMLGCNSAQATNANTLIQIPFRVCWASDRKDQAVASCELVEGNLVIWT